MGRAKKAWLAANLLEELLTMNLVKRSWRSSTHARATFIDLTSVSLVKISFPPFGAAEIM